MKCIIIYIIILFFILFFIFYKKKEGFEQKCLIVLYGESFREGTQRTRLRDTDTSYKTQMMACDSHLKFIQMLKDKYNIDSDVSISTYTTKYENELKERYKHQKVFYKSEDNVIGVIEIANKGIQNIDITNYKFIIFTRNDILFKDEFINNFKEYDKISYVSQEFTFQDCFKDGNPMVNPIIMFVPHKYFSIINDINVDHTSWKNLNNNNGLSKNDLNFMLDTYHDADSYKDWNPYYKMVGRHENDIWVDKDTPNIFLEKNECYTKVD